MDLLEQIARAFHNEYEARAVEHGWETQKVSRVEWDKIPKSNRDLMIATVKALLDKGVILVGPGVSELDPHSVPEYHDPEMPGP